MAECIRGASAAARAGVALQGSDEREGPYRRAVEDCCNKEAAGQLVHHQEDALVEKLVGKQKAISGRARSQHRANINGRWRRVGGRGGAWLLGEEVGPAKSS